MALGPPPGQLPALLPSPVAMVLSQLQPLLDLLAEVLQDGHGRLDAPGLVAGHQVRRVDRLLGVTVDGGWTGHPGANGVFCVSFKDRQSLGADLQGSEAPTPAPGAPWSLCSSLTHRSPEGQVPP